MIYVLFWILNDYIRLNIFPSSQDWLGIDVMVTLVAETNEYANIFHGSIQWLLLPNFHRPKLTHQNLSPRSLLPLGSLLVVRAQGSGVAGRAPLPLNKTELLSLYLLYYSWSTFCPKGCHSGEMFIYCTYLPQLLPSTIHIPICFWSIPSTTTFRGVAKVAQILILIKLINMVKLEPETGPEKRQSDQNE